VLVVTIGEPSKPANLPAPELCVLFVCCIFGADKKFNKLDGMPCG
jgi:hypothetical protein